MDKGGSAGLATFIEFVIYIILVSIVNGASEMGAARKA